MEQILDRYRGLQVSATVSYTEQKRIIENRPQFFLDASKLDFGNISTEDFKETGKSEDVNLYNGVNTFNSIFNPRLAATVYALGRVKMTLLNRRTKMVKIENDDATNYDWNEGGGFFRNAAIKINNYVFNLKPQIHGFKTYYYGVGRLNQ